MPCDDDALRTPEIGRGDHRVTVADRIYFTWRVTHRRPERKLPLPALVLWRAFFWTDERASWQYDLWVIAILAFVWLTPPAWIGDPVAEGPGLLGWFLPL